MSARHLFPGGTPVRLRPDSARLPLEFRLPVDRRPAVVVLALVCLWGAVGTIFTFRMLAPLTEMASQRMMAIAFALGLTITVLMLWLGWRALRLYVAEQHVIIDAGLAHYLSRTLWRAVEWHEPLADYRGIRACQLTPHDDGSPWQVIELAHNDPSRSLPLFADRGAHLPSHISRSLADLLKLPQIDSAPDC